MVTQPTGFTGSPAFLFAYALPQDDVTAPVDYNNLGKAAGQPASVNIVGLAVIRHMPTQYTATLTTATAAFPAGASMRAVALQGYFTQVNGRHEWSRRPSITSAVTRPRSTKRSPATPYAA